MLYELQGLNCANCAAKIERKLREIEGLSGATVNLLTKTIDINPDFEEDVVKILKKVEPDIKLVKKDTISNEDDKLEENTKSKLKSKLFKIILSLTFLVLGIIFSPKLHGRHEILEYVLFLIAYLLVGKEVVQTAFYNIIKGQVFDENFLMTIATVGAFAIHELPEAVGVMLFYSVGEFFQDLAVSRSRSSIVELMDIRPDYANLIVNGGIDQVSPEIVKVGDLIVIRPGEKVPLDGEVIEGTSFLDTSALTGESVPRRISPKEKIMSGMVNTSGLLKVKVEKTFGESSVSKILHLVQNASTRKAKTEQFITKFAYYYTPVVVFTALSIFLIPPLFFSGQSFSKWLYRALTLLVISCPCALVVSIPLGYFGGIGGASRQGILVKGANFLEALTNVDKVVFDKTGTLTKGVFKVTGVRAEGGYSREDLLQIAAYAEAHSSHPIAKSILEAYEGVIDDTLIKDYKEIAGHGTIVQFRDERVLAGNEKLMKLEGITLSNKNPDGTVVHIAVDGMYAGCITISDEFRPDAIKTIKELKELGVDRIAMFTGDTKAAASAVAQELKLDEYYGDLLPEEKVRKLEKLQGEDGRRRKTIFVGDGINDAPVITRADVGIAMGGLGSDAAIEAADIVIMEDMPSKVPEVIKIAGYTKKIVIQNIVFALGVKSVFLVLGAIGIATMWEAVFADVGVALLAILNSTRTLMYK